ncbi:hypothetical protein [Sediminibacillus halophilus]|uniref:Uncharacterized protein n=1 Tax=Sediminibacillus halophilus TaxID=482461 RepID=A0A1G9QX24_9BACI|nr:hypothetical protein [Sediminibacillus halophilus]SDM15586.1 hypothetical protein SAMN05216244_1712 [Sediminibacillus halophilus]
MKGFEKLTDHQKSIFDKTHKRHLKTMGVRASEDYSVENIKKMKWDKAENCESLF